GVRQRDGEKVLDWLQDVTAEPGPGIAPQPVPPMSDLAEPAGDQAGKEVSNISDHVLPEVMSNVAPVPVKQLQRVADEAFQVFPAAACEEVIDLVGYVMLEADEDGSP